MDIMGMHTNKKIGASILIIVMLMASLTGLIGSGITNSDSLVSAESIDLSRQIVADRIPMKAGSTVLDSAPGIRQLTEYRADYKASEGDNVILAAEEPPQINSLFPDVDTGRTVLLEIASGIDNGSFVPAYLYAGNQAAAYSRNDVALMELNSWMDGNIVSASYWGLQDWEFAPGEFNWLLGGDPADDAAMREYYTAPYGLDTFPAYLNSDTAGDANDLMNAGGFAIDGGAGGKYDGSGAYYSDCDSTSTGRWDGDGGAVPEFIQTDLDARIATPSDLTMTLNGSYDDVLEEGTFSLAISSIGNMGDLGYDSDKFVTTFFIVDDYNTVVQRNNALGPTGPGYTVKDYNIRYSMQQWVGTDEALEGTLTNRGETITYQDVFFSRNPVVRAANLGGGAMPAWNLDELGVIAAIYDEETMEVHQAVYYDFADNTPDVAIQASDVYYDSPTLAVVNETVYGPMVEFQTSFNLGYSNIIDCTIFADENEFGSDPWDWWQMFEVGTGGWDDYFLDYGTGEVTLNPANYPTGWWDNPSYIHAWLNYSASPNSGDVIPVHITVSNAGRSSTGSDVIVGVYDGDPSSGGALIGTENAGTIPSGGTSDVTYNWDTTGYEGYYALCIIPDHLDAISESNENNNIAPLDIYIAPPMDVGCFGITSMVDGNTYEWGPRTIDATIGNAGTTTQGPFPVKIEINHLGSTTYLLNDDCESGILPGWTPDGPAAPGWDLRENAANSPATSWDFGNGNYGAGPHDYKLEFGPFDLTGAFTSAEWKWFHNYDWEAGWDGGVLDVSADGAAWTRVVSTNGYDAALGTGYANPIDGDGGADAFTGASGGFVEDSVDLTPWLGDNTVWVRYWAGCDDFAGGGTGWNVDDIRISKKTAGLGSLYTNVKDTTLTLAQLETEQMNWMYDFDDEAEYEISVMSMLPGDAVAINNETLINIYTVNSMPPGPVTDLLSQPGGAGSTFYQQASSDIAVENNGIVNTYAATQMPADAVTEDITELFSAGGGTANALPSVIEAGDTAGTTVAQINGDDGTTNTIGKNGIMWIDNFDTSGNPDPVSAATLWMKFSTQAGHGATNDVEFSINEGGAWLGTGIVPTDGDNNRVASYNIFADGVDTIAEIAALDVHYINNDPGGADAVYFDYVWVTYDYGAAGSSYSLEHQWQFQGVPAGSTHMFYATTGFTGDDTFEYYYSQTGAFAGEETLMATDSTPGLDQFSYDLGAGFNGAFYVAVRDTDPADTTTADVVSIDEMYVETIVTTSPDDLILTWTLSSDDGAGAYDVTGYDIYKADEANSEWYEGPYSLVGNVGAGTSQYVDTNEILDPENCWYYVVATDGTYDSIDSGIVSKFDTLPGAFNVLADGVTPLSITIGTGIITLTADIVDNTTVDENVFPFLYGAEWFDTVDPGIGLANAIASPFDLFWDGPLDNFTVVIDTSSWGAGDHILSVRGNGPNGWGPVTTVTVTVTAPEYLIPVVAGWNFVSLPLLPGDTSLPNALMDTDGDTTWNTFHHYDGSAAPGSNWKTYISAFPGINHNYMDEEMGAWIFVDTVGDGFIKVTGVNPSGTTINLVAGWNMVGFPSQVEGYTAGDLKTDSGGSVTAVERFNGAAAYNTEVMPDIDQFQIGEGYWVYSTGAYAWIIP